jgi:hypothetical protein
VTFIVSSKFDLKSTLSDMNIATPAFLGESIRLEDVFPCFRSKSMFAFVSEICFL